MEIWQFEQVIYTLMPTFPFTTIGVTPLPVVNRLIFQLSGTATFP
jgi:hypothetical protein